MSRLRSAAILLLPGFSLIASAFAHDTWLIASRLTLPRGTTVTLDLTSGMAFPRLETSIKPERIAHAKCRLSARNFDLADFSPGPKSLRIAARLDEPGIATIWVDLKPRTLELTPEKVREYLDEIDAPKSIRQQWANSPGPRRWREVYTKHTKTFVRVGDSHSDRSWAEPVGMALEIVPEQDPTSLRAGDKVSVLALKNGAPLPDFSLDLVREGAAKGTASKTDREGRAQFAIGKAGRWLLRGTELRKSTQPGVEWESDFTTLTLWAAK